MAVNKEAACFGRVAAKSQNRLNVAPLRQQNVWVGLDRIVKAEGRAKVRIIGLERDGIWPLRIKNRQNVGDPAALMADELVKSANGEGWEG